jgi:hypothetical protein
MTFMTALFFALIAALSAPHALAATLRAAAPASIVTPPSRSDLDSLLKQAHELKLSEREEWLRLVHYRKTWLGGQNSEADGNAFFVSPQGRSQPSTELDATLAGFFDINPRAAKDPEGPPQTVRCQFPARYRWLSKVLPELPSAAAIVHQAPCVDYEKFRTRIAAHSATLIFSSYYVNNPSSAFGHTLLRLNRSPVGATSGGELSDFGINYAAFQTTDNPILYTVMGLAGGFRGIFSNLPYYYKVREYNDFQSRDLWEYDLSLSQEEIDAVVDHIWELGSTYFWYYYFTNNCSYHLIDALDAAVPRLHLLSRVPFWVIPIDTIKAAVDEPGLIAEVHLRPSIHSQLTQRMKGLSTEETELFDRLYDKKDFSKADIEKVDPHSAAKVLDAIADSIDFRYAVKLQEKSSEYSGWKQNLLVARSRLPAGDTIHASEMAIARPDLSHKSGRYLFGGGTSRNDLGDQRTLLQFQVRFALNDLLDPMLGYPPQSQIEFFKLTTRFEPQTHGLYVKDLRLVEVGNYAPFSRLNHGPSWRFELGADRITDARCDGCLAPLGGFLAGFSLQPLKKILTYGLVGPRATTSTGFQNEKFVAELDGVLGLRFIATPTWLWLIEGEWRRVYRQTPFETRTLSIGSRWVPDLLNGVDLSFKASDSQSEVMASYVRYF